MADTVRTPIDTAQIIKDWLSAELAPIWPNLTVALENEGWAFGDAPLLVVADDGGSMQWPVATKTTARIFSMTTGRDTEIVRRALGLLLCKPVPGIASILPGTSVIEARDKRTRADLASATVIVRARTTAV